MLLPRTCSKINGIQIIPLVDIVWNHLDNININFFKHKIIYSIGLSSAQCLCSTYWKLKTPVYPLPRRQKPTDSRLWYTQTWAGPQALLALRAGCRCAVCNTQTTQIPGGPITALSPASVRSMVPGACQKFKLTNAWSPDSTASRASGMTYTY